MTTKGGHIDFMFLAPLPHPAAGSDAGNSYPKIVANDESMHFKSMYKNLSGFCTRYTQDINFQDQMTHVSRVLEFLEISNYVLRIKILLLFIGGLIGIQTWWACISILLYTNLLNEFYSGIICNLSLP